MTLHRADLRLWSVLKARCTSSESTQAARNDAAAIAFTISLVSHVAASLQLLQEVHLVPALANDTVLRRAVHRYERFWLPLLYCHAKESSALPLAPPLDVAWVWFAHTIAPVPYREDVKAALCADDADLIWRNSTATAAPHTRSEAALEFTRRRWLKMFPHEPFNLPGLYARSTCARCMNTCACDQSPDILYSAALCAAGHVDKIRGQRFFPSDQLESKLKYDLVTACKRQFDFWHSTNLPHYRQLWFLQRAVHRYRLFLRLHRVHPLVFLVPTFDVDLVWHAHMACSMDYFDTCERLFGSVFAHDDSVNDRAAGSKLNTSWARTQELWYQQYGFPFAADGAMWRGPLPPDWSLAPLAATDPTLVPTAKVFGLTTADQALPLRQIWSANLAESGDVAMAVQATCENDPSENRLLLLQHHGLSSTAAIVSVIDMAGMVEAKGTLIGRESLPCWRCDMPPNIPALRWEDQAEATGSIPQSSPVTDTSTQSSGRRGCSCCGRLDRRERAFCIENRRDTWGVTIASWPCDSRGARSIEGVHLRLHHQSKGSWGDTPWLLHRANTQQDSIQRKKPHVQEVALWVAPDEAQKATQLVEPTNTKPNVQQLENQLEATTTNAEIITAAASHKQRLQYLQRGRHGLSLWTRLRQHLRSKSSTAAGDGLFARGQQQQVKQRSIAAASAAAAGAPASIPDHAIWMGCGVSHHPDRSPSDSSSAMEPSGVTTVVIGAHTDTAEALAVVGSFALQTMMLAADDSSVAPLFSAGLFAAGGLGPPRPT